MRIIIYFLSLSWRLNENKWQPTPILLPGKSHGNRSLVGYSLLGYEQLDMTEQLHFHFSLSCTGQGNSNPLQYSCLENPREGGAWWAAVYGVAQSRTQLKQLRSSSSICKSTQNNTCHISATQMLAVIIDSNKLFLRGLRCVAQFMPSVK